MLADSLNTGMTIETAGCGRASARSGCAPTCSSCMAPQDLLERAGHVLDILVRHAGKQREGQDALGGARRIRQSIVPQRELLAVKAVEVEGLEVQADPDVRGEEAVHHLVPRSEEHTSELQSRLHLVCRLLLEKKKKKTRKTQPTLKAQKRSRHVTCV